MTAHKNNVKTSHWHHILQPHNLYLTFWLAAKYVKRQRLNKITIKIWSGDFDHRWIANFAAKTEVRTQCNGKAPSLSTSLDADLGHLASEKKHQSWGNFRAKKRDSVDQQGINGLMSSANFQYSSVAGWSDQQQGGVINSRVEWSTAGWSDHAPPNPNKYIQRPIAWITWIKRSKRLWIWKPWKQRTWEEATTQIHSCNGPRIPC